MARRVLTPLVALACGIAIAGAVAGLILWVTNDMRLVLLLGATSLFAAAAIIGRHLRGGIVSFLMLCSPLMLIFGLFAVPELPRLWPHLPFWFCFALLAWLGFQPKRRLASVAAGLTLSVLAGWYALSYVPGAISQSLNLTLNEPAPSFSLVDLDGVPIPAETFENKVVVLDFFATWCAPCIVELPEIDAIHQRYAGNDDVVVLVVANDSGRDTPASIQRFAEARGLHVSFVYDPEGTAHEAFGFAGLPGLAVVDRAGLVRFRREGYNSAETGFENTVVGVVEALRLDAAQ